MTIKTTQARSIPTRVAIAFAGTAEAPIAPVMATAYARDGKVVIATVRWSGTDSETTQGRVREFKSTERIRWSADPAAVKAHGLRYCRTCAETHLLRVGTDKYATLVCDTRARELGRARRTAKKAGTYVPAKVARKAAAVERRDTMIDTIMERAPRTREQMIGGLLAAVAGSQGTDSKRFEVICSQYGMTVEQGVDLMGRL